MFQMPFCLMVQGTALTDSMRYQLAETANNMLLSQEKEGRFRSDIAEGLVETDFQTAVVGCFHGIVFKGVVESNRGRTKIDFIVRPQKKFPAETEIFWSRSSITQARNAPLN